MIETVSTQHVRRPRWLVVVPEFPRADYAGGDRRLVEILQIILATCDVFMLATGPGRADDAKYAARLSEIGVRFAGRGLWDGWKTLIRRKFDAVFFEFYHTTPGLLRAVKAVQPHALIIVDSVDLHYLREREMVRLGTLSAHFAAQSERLEIEAYRMAEVTVAVSHAERDILEARGISNIAVIPILVPIVERLVRDRTSQLLFIGGFAHGPNPAAVEWFHKSVWPLVRQRVPDATWVIAGSDTPSSILALDGTDGIRVMGFVPSTLPLLDESQVSIAPLTFGAGMKVKVSEALAAGLPVVTTTWGAQGLEKGAGWAYLRADAPQDFADAVVLLLTSELERARFSAGAQKLAAELCSTSAATPVVVAMAARSVRRSRGALPGRVLSFASFAAGRLLKRVSTTRA